MKISLNWLSDYLPGPLDAERAADVLTHGGFPVESIEAHPKLGKGDTVLDVEVTSNRGDCLSHLGVARELSALLVREFRDIQPAAKESATTASSVTSVAIEAPELCPHYLARVIRGVKIGPSPAWLAQRLEAVGLRPINNVVDVTNYVLFETGQPLHAFDFDKLDGKKIVVRRAREGEPLVSLDGHERKLRADMLVIADGARAVALAGVMGGRDSEVTDQTTSILLEAARFDPLSVRKTARALAMRSDSSYRFERGIDPLLPAKASLRAAQLILETAGGELLSGIVEARPERAQRGEPADQNDPLKKLSLRLPRLKQVIGIEFPADQVLDALKRLGLAPARQGDRIEVTVPSHRLDINLEIDLIEEVARVIGYDKVPIRDEIAIRLTPSDPNAGTVETIRSTLVAGGYFEAVTVGFVSDLLAGDFVPPEALKQHPLPVASAAVRKADGSLRPSILPLLLESVRHNETAGTENARLFEMGSTFWNNAAGQVDERRRLALIGSPDLREVRGVVETLLGRLDANRPVRVVPDSRPGFARGATGRIEWGNEPVGYLGRVEKAVADKLSLRGRPVMAELEMAALLKGAQHVPQLRPLPKFPSVRRDLSFVMSESVRFDALETTVRNTQPQWMEDLEYVTTYRGKPLEKGTKSVTITLVFRSPTETLTSEQVETSVGKVVAAAQRDLGAALRT